MKNINLGKGQSVKLDKLIETRLLVQGASGSGKSTLVRQLLEQTSGKAQQIIIDPEGEFATLRSVGEYLYCAKDGDIPTDPKTAAVLAKRIRQTGVSAIIDIYELKAHQRQEFVAKFLGGMIAAPKKYWRDSLVFVDEAHVLAPQSTRSVSLSEMQDLASRGRKRRLGMIVATQRLSKLHKDVAAECNNRLIGQTGLKIDLRSAADEMGMTYAEAREALLKLDPGQFWAFGPALAPEYTLFNASMPKTVPAGPDTPKITTPPAVAAVIEQLADLPNQAKKEAQTLIDLKKELANVRRENTRLAKEVSIKPKDQAPAVIHCDHVAMMKDIETLAQRILVQVGPAANKLPASKPAKALMTATKHSAPTKQPVNGELNGPEQRILDAIAWMEHIGVTEPEQTAVAFLAGYRYGGGAFNNPRGRLRQTGLIEYVGKQVKLTEAGRDLANFPDIEPTAEGLQNMVMSRLNGPEQRVLQPLLDSYPESISNDNLADAAGYAAGAGSFNNPKGRLRSLGLIDYPQPGHAVARDILFPV